MVGRLTPNSAAIADIVGALAVFIGLVIHLARQIDLTRPELWLLPAGAPSGAGRRRPVDGAF